MIGKSQELKENVMHKTFKFHLIPTKDQEVLLAKHFGCVRFIYNHFLSEKQKHYLQNKTTLKFNECQNMLIKQKKDEGYTWLKEVNSQALILKH
jgi:putative transposase